jgi:hypothetical protein
MTVAEFRGRQPPAPGEQVTLSAPAEDIHVFDADDRRVATGA